jgi:hypothetical protein
MARESLRLLDSKENQSMLTMLNIFSNVTVNKSR